MDFSNEKRWSTNTVIVNLVHSIVFVFSLIIIARTFPVRLKGGKNIKVLLFPNKGENIYSPIS